MSAQTIPEVLRRAFLLAEAPPGGPSFVTFSKDLFERRVPSCEIIPRSRSRVSSEVAPSADQVRRIANNLLAAKRPCIFVGNECIRHEISTEVAGIAEATGAMVMNSVKIPVVFPNTHPNFVGEVGTDDPELIHQVDALWSLGGHMFKLFSLPPEPLLKRSAVVMHTSMIADDVGRNYPVDIATISSLKTTSRMVLEELQGRETNTADVRAKQQWVENYTAEMREKNARIAHEEWDSTPIATSRLFGELNRIVDDSAYLCNELITSDAYPRKYLDFDHTRPPETRRREFYTTGGILGWGVAAAIGTKIGNPDKEVWCLTGDGCF